MRVKHSLPRYSPISCTRGEKAETLSDPGVNGRGFNIALGRAAGESARAVDEAARVHSHEAHFLHSAVVC